MRLAGSQDLLDHTTTDGSNGDGSLPDESATVNPLAGSTHHNGDATR